MNWAGGQTGELRPGWMFATAVTSAYSAVSFFSVKERSSSYVL